MLTGLQNLSEGDKAIVVACLLLDSTRSQVELYDTVLISLTKQPLENAARAIIGRSRPHEGSKEAFISGDTRAWLKSLRLHKYSECFDGLKPKSIITLTDEDLYRIGVSSSGARGRFLRAFENIHAFMASRERVRILDVETMDDVSKYCD